jgi:hypothetical protein
MENNEDQVWLDVLSGKSVKSANKRLVLDAKLLRASIKEYTAEEKAHELTLRKIKNSLHAQGFFESSSNKNFGSNSVSILKKIKVIVVFALGLIAGTLVPIQLATRGTHDSSFFDRFKGSNQNEQISIRLTIKDKAPLTLAKDIIFTAMDSKVEVKVLNNDGLHLVIYGLKSLDESQISLKATLGLGGEAEGNAEVVILKNE